MEIDSAEAIELAIRQDGRYAFDAFPFLQRGLSYATQLVHGKDTEDVPRHVSGRQLCHALRALALQEWGPMAGVVLSRWNIHRTRDFGEMVYLLIGMGLLGKQDTDHVEDFDDVYDFAEAFAGYEVPLDAVE